MLLRSGRRTSKDPVNITDRQAGHSNPHLELNVSEDSTMANQTLKQLAAPNLATQPPSITSDLGKRMDEGQSSMMEAQLANLTAMVSKLMTGGNAKASLCGIFCLEGHTTDMCPTLQEGEANAVFPNQRQQPSHQNLSAETKTHAMLEQMMKMMADQKKETDGRFQSLESAVKQLQTRASSTDVNLGNLQAQVNNRLPSQPVVNPRDNVSAITLRSGKELRSILKKAQNSNEEGETEENLALPKADLQPSQAAPKEVGKSRLQRSIASHDAANFEQKMRVPELRAQADVYELGEEDELKSVLAKSIFDIDKQEFVISDSLIDSVYALDWPKLT
ncbi:hypothetical protein GOBAR_DD01445 [Gossypium barbadense]|nr:hypothetical protein GOBAR_DD01445 [Gossypium barbadense]